MLLDWAMGAAAVNAALLTALLWVYVRNLRELRTVYTIGLTVFAAVMLVSKLLDLYLWLTMRLDHVGAEGLVLASELVQVVAIGALTWITYR